MWQAGYAFLSLFFGRRFWYPHLRHRVARMAFLALQRMHIFTLSSFASASGNRAISEHHFLVFK